MLTYFSILNTIQVNKAVIAVPAKFSQLQRQATAQAYKNAGLKVLWHSCSFVMWVKCLIDIILHSSPTRVSFIVKCRVFNSGTLIFISLIFVRSCV